MLYSLVGPDKGTLTIEEAAAWLGINVTTIKLLARQGRFPRPVKVSKKEPGYWLAEDLAAWRQLSGKLRADAPKKNPPAK